MGKSNKIKETKVTCKACGHTWFYGKSEAVDSFGDKMSNLGKDMSCLTGCPLGCIPKKQTKDLSKCEKCGSKAVKKEVVEHEV